KPGDERAQRVYGWGCGPPAPLGGHRAREASHPRHAGRHDLRIGIEARTGGASLCTGARRERYGDDRGIQSHSGAGRCRAGQWRPGAFGRDRRLAWTFTLASGMRCGAGGLAAGEEFGIDGARFLRAVTLGYDVGPRVTMAMGGVAFSNESHKSTHAIAGAFGAAAAAACAAGLDAQQMRWLLDYTAQQSSGIAAWGRD